MSIEIDQSRKMRQNKLFNSRAGKAAGMENASRF